MSKLSNEFLEIVRQSIRPEKVLTFLRYCHTCQHLANHTSEQTGLWEKLTCNFCGQFTTFKTK